MSQVKSQPLLGHLSLYTTSPSLPLFESVPSQQPQQDPSQPSPQHLPHALIFVPGLTDTLGTVPFLPRLASEVERLGYSLVQPQLSSALGGWGVASLDGDAKVCGHVRCLVGW